MNPDRRGRPSALTDAEIRQARRWVAKREQLRDQANQLSNEAIARHFRVCAKTIERAMADNPNTEPTT